jgi:serine/threonine protein kinase
MGTVSTVRKKKHKVGLSARYNIEARQQAQEKIDACFNFPIFGPIFRYFLKDKANTMLEEASLSHHHLKSDDGTSATGATSFSSSSSSSMVYAMKSIHLHCVKDPTFVNELKNEIEVLKTLDHPHIIKIFETFDYNKQIFVVMELCSGGDLYSRDPYTEEDAARITSGILSAVAYMHSKGVLHRDLKYENILFTDGSPKAPIKLIDFGLSREVMEHEKLTDLAGTIYTMAPEVIQGQYGKPADLWSVGVIAYMLMSSQMPFYGTKRREVVNRILVGKYDYKGRRWKRISEQGKAFVEDLLVLDPDDRSTADEALRASWLHRRHAATVRNPQEGELENVRRSLKRYVRYPKLRRLALMVIAHKSTTDEIGILRKVFQHYDTDRRGP